jgi:hypothetical protein
VSISLLCFFLCYNTPVVPYPNSKLLGPFDLSDSRGTCPGQRFNGYFRKESDWGRLQTEAWFYEIQNRVEGCGGWVILLSRALLK